MYGREDERSNSPPRAQDIEELQRLYDEKMQRKLKRARHVELPEDPAVSLENARAAESLTNVRAAIRAVLPPRIYVETRKSRSQESEWFLIARKTSDGKSVSKSRKLGNFLGSESDLRRVVDAAVPALSAWLESQ